MRSLLALLVAVVGATSVVAQETGAYSQGENPFQADYEFVLGRPIEVRVDVQGVRIDQVTLLALEEVRPGSEVRGEIQIAGSNVGDKKATLTLVMLLEDANGKGLGRVSMEPFKAKTGKPFDQRQKVTIAANSLNGALRVFLFVQAAF